MDGEAIINGVEGFNLGQQRIVMNNRLECRRTTPQPAARGKEGFTIMEVMISVLILAVVILGTFATIARGFSLIEVSRDETRVAQILQSEIEDVRTINWAALSLLPASATYQPNTRFTAQFGNRYSVTRTISTRAVDQKQIVVTVNWTDNGGVARSRQYITWFTKDGLYDYYYRSL